MPEINLTQVAPMYRDPLSQYLQQFDPDSPDARVSAERARAAQRVARAAALQLIFDAEPGPAFDRFFLSFFGEDRQILEAVRHLPCYARAATLAESEGL